MPCIAKPRGFTDTKYPWSDVVNNDPCGKPVVTSAGGINVSAENLCLFHLGLKRGLALINPPIVQAP